MNKEFMVQALIEANFAANLGEVPVGAVVVHNNEVVARAHNLRETNNDPTAHAEILALQAAGKFLDRWNLSDCDLYVTLEPCAMCGGAIVNSRISRVYFGAYDKRFGCCGTVYNLANDSKFNHRAIVEGGIMEEECSGLISSFFNALRKKTPMREL